MYFSFVLRKHQIFPFSTCMTLFSIRIYSNVNQMLPLVDSSMQRIAQLAYRQIPAVVAGNNLPVLARSVSAGAPPSSFNPEAYMRFPQFLHDINNKLLVYKNTQDTQGLLDKGRLVYSSKCVTVEVLPC